MASQTDPLELATPPQPGLADVMAAISTCQATLTAKIEAVQLDVGLLRQVIDKSFSKVSKAEQQVGQAKDTVIHSLQKNLGDLEYKAEDAENMNKRKTFASLGWRKVQRGANWTVFIEDLLHKLLPDAHLLPYYMVERTYRNLPKLGPPGSPP